MTDNEPLHEGAENNIAQNQAPEAFSDKEIAEMAGNPPPTQKEPETNQEDEKGGDVAEEESTPPEPEQKETKPRSKYIPRERFDEANEQKNLLKKQAETLEAQLKQEREAKQKLIDFINAATNELKGDGTPTEDHDDIVDEAAYKKVNSRIDNLEKQAQVGLFQAALDAEDRAGREKFPDYDEATGYLVASEAFKIQAKHSAKGRALGDEEALAMAMRDIGSDLFDIYKSGGKRGDIASYVYKQAAVRGFKAQQGEKPASASDKPKINMKAVERAREEAGAPAIQRESVKINGSNWQDQYASEAKEVFGKGNEKYLKQMGILS